MMENNAKLEYYNYLVPNYYNFVDLKLNKKLSKTS